MSGPVEELPLRDSSATPPPVAATSSHAGKLALVLAGGGARAAYQVGFLRSLARSFPELEIPIVTGVSAGAINAAHIANHRGTFPEAIQELTDLWQSITIDQVFRTDLGALGLTMLRWAIRLVSGGVNLSPPAHGLVDTEPLRKVIAKALAPDGGPLPGIADNIRSGRLSAVGITTTNYTTGESNSWVQGHQLTAWERPGRRSVAAEITVDHIMASCALPLFFPAAQIGPDWHGDGGIRLTAPLSPALHLGAHRMIAISTQCAGGSAEPLSDEPRDYPAPATIIGLLLDSIFLDMLDYDVLNTQRFNSLIEAHPRPHETGLHPVQLLLIRPSQDLGVIANEFEAELPRTFRFVTRGLGTREARRADMLATLMFQPGYIRRLIELGEADGERRRDEVAAFLRPVRPGLATNRA